MASGPVSILARGPFPKPGEAFSGYARRLAEANRLGNISTLASLMGCGTLSPRPTGDQWARLAKAAGLDGGRFEQMRLPGHQDKHADIFDLQGLKVRTNQISLSRLKACPACLGEGRAVLSEWQLHAVTACGIHDVALVDSCATCTRPIGYLDRRYLWTCPECGTALADLPRTPATPHERAFRRWSLEGATSAPPGFASLDLVDRLSVVERLGKLGRSAAEDRPSDRRTTHPHGAVDFMDTKRTVDEARNIVEAGMDVLTDWPLRYDALLRTLLDRHPARNKDPLLRRFGSHAGYIAMKPLFGLTHRSIDFVENARLGFTGGNVGRVRPEQPHLRFSSVFTDLDDFAKRATLPASEYAGFGNTAVALGGRHPDFIRQWVAAGLLELQRRPDGSHAVSRRDVAGLLSRLRGFPPDAGQEGYFDGTEIPTMTNRHYARSDLYIDLMDGEIHAVLRHPERTGLPALAISTADLKRRQASAWLARHAIDDKFCSMHEFNKATTAVWGQRGKITAAEATQAAKKDLGRRSARHMLILIQRRKGQRHVFWLSEILKSTAGRSWREVVADEYKAPGFDEITFYGIDTDR